MAFAIIDHQALVIVLEIKLNSHGLFVLFPLLAPAPSFLSHTALFLKLMLPESFRRVRTRTCRQIKEVVFRVTLYLQKVTDVIILKQADLFAQSV
jgi:hypothetical protein